MRRSWQSFLGWVAVLRAVAPTVDVASVAWPEPT